MGWTRRFDRWKRAAAAAAVCCMLSGGGRVRAAGAPSDSASASPSGRTAAMLLDRLESRRGVGVILGRDDDLAVELARSSRMLWHVRDPRPAVVETLRAKAEKAGLDIHRLAVERGGLDRLPYADNTIDVVVAASPPSDSRLRWTLAEVLRVLRPRGVAIVQSLAGPAAEADALSQARSAGAESGPSWTDSSGRWSLLRKPARAGEDSWSHWQHGPDNNPVSSDTVIRAPYLTQFMAGPMYIGMPSVTTAAGGRTFLAIGHIAHHRREWDSLNTLVARNGYNGQILWTRSLPEGYLVHRSAFVATPDTFYLLDGAGCLLLDPATGEQKGRLRIPGAKGQWKWMAIRDGVLYALAGPKDPGVRTMRGDRNFSGWSWADLSPGYYAPRVPCGFGRTLAAYQLDAAKTLWTHREPADIDSRAMAIAGGKIFLYCPDRGLRCLSLKTGEPIWTNEDAKLRELIEQPGRGLISTPGFRTEPLAVATPKALILQGQTRMNVVAVSTEDGHLLWTKKKVTSNPNAIYVDGKVILGIGPGGDHVELDPVSGRELEDLHFRKVSCTRLTASPDSFFCRGEGTLRFDRATGRVFIDGAVRPACNDGALPANGLLYLGPWQCDCNLQLIGCIAKCSAGDFRIEEQAGPARLEKGEGSLEKIAPLSVAPEDWPTDRHDLQRSGASPVPAAPGREAWRCEPRGAITPTAPVAAGGLVFFGADDGKLRALDARSGRRRWEFATSAPIKSPPTIWEGRLYFGAGDGWAYALEAATGRLLWRFRAAPIERYIMVYGSLCSTWPVHTGVLVEDGVAYFAAGIIDTDGTWLWALDARTGEILWENNSCGRLDPVLRKGVSAQGNLTVLGDQLLLAGGNQVSPARFDKKTGECLVKPVRLGRPAANGGKFVGVFRDAAVIAGGRVLYSSPQNVATKGGFVAFTKSHAYSLNMGAVPPAWNDDVFAVVNFRDGRLACYDADKVAARIEQGLDRPRPDRNRWLNNLAGLLEADGAFRWRTDLGQPQSFEAESLAVCPNAVIVVARLQQMTRSQPQWFVAALDPQSGQPLFRQELPGAPLPGGLLIDRDGRIVLTMLDGAVLCYARRR